MPGCRPPSGGEGHRSGGRADPGRAPRDTGDRPPQAARVLRVVAGQGLEQQRAVLDAPRQRAAVIERVGVGDHARAAHQAERGHQADDTAQRGRAPDRSPGIRSERRRDEARRDGRPRARGGAAGEVGEVPGVARRGPRQIERRPGMRHLVGGELAEQHRTRIVEPGGRRGVSIGDPVDEDARVRGREDAPRVVDVLEPEGDAVQRAARRARGDLGLGLPGLLPRQIERARDEGARLAVVLLDALDQRLDQIDGRQLPRRDQAGQLGDREVVEIGCHGVVPSCVTSSVPTRADPAPRTRYRQGHEAPPTASRQVLCPARGAGVDSCHAFTTPRGRGDPGRGAGGLRSHREDSPLRVSDT